MRNYVFLKKFAKKICEFIKFGCLKMGDPVEMFRDQNQGSSIWGTREIFSDLGCVYYKMIFLGVFRHQGVMKRGAIHMKENSFDFETDRHIEILF